MSKDEKILEPTFNANTEIVTPVSASVTTAEEQGKSREKALADRALKRSGRRESSHALAEDLCKAGDMLLERGDYATACTSYIGATELWTSNPLYYLKLTAAYLKCDLFVEATHAATRALSLDPKSLEARYLRGVARLEEKLLPAAKIDFHTVLEQDPNHVGAQTSLATVMKLLDDSSKLGPHRIASPSIVLEEESQDVDFDFPHYLDDKLELASLSDSSDCNHVGNGIPCRFYNHQGCARGNACIFSHAPDEKSVRDNLGKNVCVYYLLSTCRFGAAKCVYAHSKDDLSTTQGWWNNPSQIEKVRSVLEMAEKKTKEQRALDKLLYKLEAAKKVKAGKRKTATKGAGKRKDVVASRTPGSDKGPKISKVFGDGVHVNDIVGDSDGEIEQRMRNGGFTDDDLDELLSQGVKPWDDDAYDVLVTLSY